jgi:hypothetical protein
VFAVGAIDSTHYGRIVGIERVDSLISVRAYLTMSDLMHRWRHAEKRGPLDIILKASLPSLFSIGTTLLQEVKTSMHPDAAFMLKLVLKCYHGAIQNELPKILQEENNLTAWLQLFYETATVVVPVDLSMDIEDRGKHMAFKVKKWAYRSMLRLFGRYINLTGPRLIVMKATGTPRWSLFAIRHTVHSPRASCKNMHRASSIASWDKLNARFEVNGCLRSFYPPWYLVLPMGALMCQRA